MGVFDDKKFDELDWISQAVEPIESRLNDFLAQIPEEIVLDFNSFNKIMKESYNFSITPRRALDFIFGNATAGKLSWNESRILENCITLAIEGEVILNYEDQTISGGAVKILKKTNTLDEKILQKILGLDGIDYLSSLDFTEGNGAIGRINEIFELLGKCDEALRTKSSYKKDIALRKRLTELFSANEWKIKDTELANKISRWIVDYVNDGNLASYSNFCKLKVMTHKEQAIYSIEEVV